MKFIVHFFNPIVAQKLDGEIKSFNRMDHGIYQLEYPNGTIAEAHISNFIIVNKE